MPNYTWNSITSDENTIAALLNSEKKFSFNNLITIPKELENTISGGHIGECICYYLLTKYPFEQAKNKISKLNVSNNFSYHRKKLKKDTMESLLKSIGENPRMFNDELHYETVIDPSGKESTGVVRENYNHTPEEIGEYYYGLFEKYGYCNWYDWSNRNWGTKWDAFDVYTDETNISFTTAWSHPEPIIDKICAMFPNSEIEFSFEYEDGYLEEGFNHNGYYVTKDTYERVFEDDDDNEGTWISNSTGEEYVA